MKHRAHVADFGELSPNFAFAITAEFLHHEIAAEKQAVELLYLDENGALGPPLIHLIQMVADQRFPTGAMIEEAFRCPEHPTLAIRIGE